MTLTQIKPAGLSTPVDLADNAKIRLGTGNDLEIYHNSTSNNSHIDESGSGSLVIKATNTYINSSADEAMIAASADGSVELYYDNSKKFETINSGVLVTGTLKINDGSSSTNRIAIGNSGDLLIYHDGTYNTFAGANFLVRNAAANETLIYAVENGASELWYDNSKKAETTANGLFVTGSLWADGLYLDDNEKIHLGTSGADLDIYHDGTHSYLDNSTGNLHIRGNGADDVKIQAKNGEQSIICHHDGAVELYHDNSKKFETNSNGCLMLDNSKLLMGDDGDLQIYHNGSAWNIIDNINNKNFAIQMADGSENAVVCLPNGAVKLYYDSVEKFETLSTGTRTSGNVQLPFADANNGLRNKISWTSQADYFDEVAYIAADRTALSGAVTDLVFATGSANAVSEAMRINSNGEVLVGTTSALNLGANNVTGVTIFPSGRVTAARSSSSSAHFGRQGSNGEVVLFACQGTAIVGTISVTTSSTAFNTSYSDRTLKKNFENWTENTLDLFKNINPQKFNFTHQEDTDTKHKGYIAQDLVSSFPEAYNKGDNDKYMFNPSGMVVYLMKAIQELEAEVAALKAA